MASLRRNTTILALSSSLFCSMPLEVQADPGLVATAKETPKAQRCADSQGKQTAQRDDDEPGQEEDKYEAWSERGALDSGLERRSV